MVAKSFPDYRAGQDHGTQIEVEDARQGATTGYMRRVLTISVVLATLAMAGALWAFYWAGPKSTVKAGAPEAPILQRDQTPAPTQPRKVPPSDEALP